MEKNREIVRHYESIARQIVWHFGFLLHLIYACRIMKVNMFNNISYTKSSG